MIRKVLKSRLFTKKIKITYKLFQRNFVLKRWILRGAVSGMAKDLTHAATFKQMLHARNSCIELVFAHPQNGWCNCAEVESDSTSAISCAKILER